MKTENHARFWIFLAVLSVSGAVWAQNSKADLEQANEQAQQIVKQAKDTMKRGSTSEPEAATKRVSKSAPQLVSMAALLRGGSDKAKKEFLDSILIVDGKFASANLYRLKQELGEARVAEINRVLNPHPGKMFKKTPFHTLALCNGSVCEDAVCQSGSDGHLACYDSRRNTCYGPCNAFMNQ